MPVSYIIELIIDIEDAMRGAVELISHFVENSNIEETVSKTEPILDDHDSTDDTKLDENTVSSEFENDEEVVPEDDFNQEKEDELLDIPTFLRRQAN